MFLRAHLVMIHKTELSIVKFLTLICGWRVLFKGYKFIGDFILRYKLSRFLGRRLRSKISYMFVTLTNLTNGILYS